MRTHSIRSVLLLAPALLLAACATADPSASPGPNASALSPIASPDAVAAGTPGPTAIAPTPTAPPRAAGTVLVWQLDGTDGTTATTESLFRLDLANGATVPVATVPVNEDTCCPTALRLSRDRGTALLYAANYRGAVDLATGTFEKASARIPRGDVAISHAGDQLAWIDELTGTSESIVIAGRDGKRSNRIALPAGSFASIPAWSQDDSALLVTTMLPVKTGSEIRLASWIACCSIDRGVQATHVLLVPLDGSSIRDIYDDTAGVLSDRAQPTPTTRPGANAQFAWPASHSLQAWLGPDNRTALVASKACPYQWRTHGPTGISDPVCTDQLMTIDTQTRQRTPLPAAPTSISSAAWSPDGRRLSLLGSVGGGPTGSDVLSILDRASGSIVTLGPAEPDLMSWSDDGQWIAYWRLDPAIAEGGDRVQVWVAPTSGGEPRFVAAHATVAWLEP
jgi:hypothetical protein